MRAFDTQDARNAGLLAMEDTAYLYDIRDHRSPLNAGLNAGVVFGWSAICRAEGLPNRDARLDDRVWVREDLVPRVQSPDMGFWKKMMEACESME
jgi:hypothetical protein